MKNQTLIRKAKGLTSDLLARLAAPKLEGRFPILERQRKNQLAMSKPMRTRPKLFWIKSVKYDM